MNGRCEIFGETARLTFSLSLRHFDFVLQKMLDGLEIFFSRLSQNRDPETAL